MAVTDIAGGAFFQAELRVCGPVMPKRAAADVRLNAGLKGPRYERETKPA